MIQILKAVVCQPVPIPSRKGKSSAGMLVLIEDELVEIAKLISRNKSVLHRLFMLPPVTWPRCSISDLLCRHWQKYQTLHHQKSNGFPSYITPKSGPQQISLASEIHPSCQISYTCAPLEWLSWYGWLQFSNVSFPKGFHKEVTL